MSDVARQFYMVVGAGSPTVRHATYAEAETEAKRLADTYPDRTFHILKAIKVTQSRYVPAHNAVTVNDLIP